MAYTHIPTGHIRDPELRRAFNHASAMLADCYTMLGVRPAPGSNGGRCNFAIALVLACIVDGLAMEAYPCTPSGRRGDQFLRIAKLLERMPWGDKRRGWITRREAAQVFYDELRNPLVHYLGGDTHPKRRRPGFSDAAGILELHDNSTISPDRLEQLETWPPDSPVMWVKPRSAPGKRRIVVSMPALYWHVKALARSLAKDSSAIRAALEHRKRRQRLRPAEGAK
jgi:hypothetical protein